MWARIGIFLTVALSHVAVSHNIGKVGCYYGRWAAFNTGMGTYNTSHIDPFACNCLYYTFFGISTAGEITSLDPHNDFEDDNGMGTIKMVNDLKKINPDLETFASVGGWDVGSTNFSIVAKDADLRKKFSKSVVEFLIKYKFNGVDVDWIYPMQRHELQYDDRTNFNLLLKALKEALTPYGLKLHIGVSPAESSAKKSYDFAAIAELVDNINIIAYDLHKATEPFVEFNAPLYPSKRDTTAQARELADDSILKFWTSVVPAEKLCLGVPFYGHSFMLADPKKKSPGALSKGPAPAGPLSEQEGVLNYNELCMKWQTESWTKKFDYQQQAPYAYKNGVWVSYENAKSIFLKGQMALKYKLNCVTGWSLDNDDFHGFCGEGKSPLLYALKRGINTPLKKEKSKKIAKKDEK